MTEQQKLFLSGLRSGPGFICTCVPGGKFQQQWFADEESAGRLVLAKHKTSNIWCSMASFSDSKTRSADNAVSLKAFWFDIDAHGDGYASPLDCLLALQSFVRVTGLPRPTHIQATGHGVQAFWVLARAIGKDEWQPIAVDLQELGRRHNLGADPITADPARILRVPGTLNFRKPDEPRDTVLHELKPGLIELIGFRSAIEEALAKADPIPVAASKARRPADRASAPCLWTAVSDTPRQRACLAELLRFISADCSYELYRSVVWAIMSTGWHDGEELARQWCITAPHRFEDDNFTAVATSHDPARTPTLGTLIYRAREGGWDG